MKKLRLFLPLTVPIVLFSCHSENKVADLPEELQKQYFEVTKLADECADLLADYQADKSFDKFLAMNEKIPNLDFCFEDEDLDEEQYRQCRQKKVTVDSIKRKIKKVLREDLGNFEVTIAQETDKLVNSAFSVPFQGKRGDELKLKAFSANNYTFKIYNADSRQLIYNSKQQRQIDEIIPIANSAIYLLEFTCSSPIYIDFSLTKKASSLEDFTLAQHIVVDTVACLKGDFRSQKVDGVKLKNMFEEPRKVTLRSQGKALFSGSSRSLVAVNIPAGTADIMYSLRISTSEHDTDSDGEFFDRTNRRYHQIKFLGLPIYESSRNDNSLIRELLSVSRPEREEEAYCSMYVFKTASEARKFQNNKPLNSLQYNLDHSIVGTQSCNGRIPVQGMKTLYLGFDNPKMTSSVYIWLEVVGAVRSTEYFKEKYVVK